MAVFDAAVDAVAAAVAIQQGAERHNRTAADTRRVAIRIGCSAGDVQFVAGDFHGTPAVEAARLEAASAPGEVWVSELVRSLVGSRGRYRFEALGTLELKGLATPERRSTGRQCASPSLLDDCRDPRVKHAPAPLVVMHEASGVAEQVRRPIRQFGCGVQIARYSLRTREILP